MNDWTIDRLVDELAAPGAPGGGSAAVVSALTAAGVLKMAVRQAATQGEELEREIDQVRQRLNYLAEQDARVLALLLATAAGSDAREQAALQAATLPQQTAKECLDLLTMAVGVMAEVPSHLTGDTYIAGVLLRAALEGAWACSLMNGPLLPGEAAKEIAEQVHRERQAADLLTAQLRAALARQREFAPLFEEK